MGHWVADGHSHTRHEGGVSRAQAAVGIPRAVRRGGCVCGVGWYMWMGWESDCGAGSGDFPGEIGDGGTWCGRSLCLEEPNTGVE